MKKFNKRGEDGAGLSPVVSMIIIGVLVAVIGGYLVFNSDAVKQRVNLLIDSQLKENQKNNEPFYLSNDRIEQETTNALIIFKELFSENIDYVPNDGCLIVLDNIILDEDENLEIISSKDPYRLTLKAIDDLVTIQPQVFENLGVYAIDVDFDENDNIYEIGETVRGLHDTYVHTNVRPQSIVLKGDGSYIFDENERYYLKLNTAMKFQFGFPVLVKINPTTNKIEFGFYRTSGDDKWNLRGYNLNLFSDEAPALCENLDNQNYYNSGMNYIRYLTEQYPSSEFCGGIKNEYYCNKVSEIYQNEEIDELYGTCRWWADMCIYDSIDLETAKEFSYMSSILDLNASLEDNYDLRTDMRSVAVDLDDIYDNMSLGDECLFFSNKIDISGYSKQMKIVNLDKPNYQNQIALLYERNNDFEYSDYVSYSKGRLGLSKGTNSGFIDISSANDNKHYIIENGEIYDSEIDKSYRFTSPFSNINYMDDIGLYIMRKSEHPIIRMVVDYDLNNVFNMDFCSEKQFCNNLNYLDCSDFRKQNQCEIASEKCSSISCVWDPKIIGSDCRISN